MATVSFIPESHQSISAMKAVIEYCLQQKKVADADSSRRLVTAEQVHEIGLAFAKKAWPGHEVLATTHTDVAHLHNHFVINSVHYENGIDDKAALTQRRYLSVARAERSGTV